MTAVVGAPFPFKDLGPADRRALFRAVTLGRLTGGAVHNLNGLLQVVFMQLELLDMDLAGTQEGPPEGPQEIRERLQRLRPTLGKMEALAGRLQSRWSAGGEGDPVTRLSLLVVEGVEFWRNDLFFKHEVEVEMELKEEVILPLSPSTVCLLLDAAMGRAILALKAHGGGRLTLSHHGGHHRTELRLSWEGRDGGEEVAPGPLEREAVALGWELAQEEAHRLHIELREGRGEIAMAFPLSL